MVNVAGHCDIHIKHSLRHFLPLESSFSEEKQNQKSQSISVICTFIDDFTHHLENVSVDCMTTVCGKGSNLAHIT